MIYDDFSYQGYKNIVKEISVNRRNLCFRDFANGKNDDTGSFFILRHDIDYSPESALTMAEMEAEMGLRASYFILFSSPFYNVLTEEHLHFPKNLIGMGHEVGLHYDVSVLEKWDGEKKSEKLKVEIDMLSELAGKEVTSIAMHNPSVSGSDPFRKGKYINSYDDRFIKDASYFSDSCGAWRDEFVQHISDKTFPSKIQLLTHPIFWDLESRNRWQTLHRFISGKKNQLSNTSMEVTELWSKHSGVLQHDNRNNPQTIPPKL